MKYIKDLEEKRLIKGSYEYMLAHLKNIISETEKGNSHE